jgi:magnesium chelatase family protein
MLSTVCSAAISGIHGYMVDVEVDLSFGLPGMTMVGLPDTAVQEARERVRGAIRNSGLQFPAHKIVVNMAPAHTRKTGPVFDLAVAIGVLLSSEQLSCTEISEWMLTGELSLNGAVRPVQGVLAFALAAIQAGKTRILVPTANAQEAALVKGLAVYPVDSLLDAVRVLSQTPKAQAFVPQPLIPDLQQMPIHLDFADVKGQSYAKRGLEIAAAGGHNLLMMGPPGSGKTMLARRLVGILPPLEQSQALETTTLYSICGRLPADKGLVQYPPFRSPHHAITMAGLLGGQRYAKPGEISLAHNGVLFLDELLEFRREVLEVLRQPLEDRQVTIARVQGAWVYPADFILIAAMNPCPCGYAGDLQQPCQCTPGQVERYWNKLSGPLLDRIDLHLEVPRLQEQELLSPKRPESSQEIRMRVLRARERQSLRFAGSKLKCNAQMQAAEIREYCQTDTPTRQLLQNAVQKMQLSARAYDRILKLARTLADLEGKEKLTLPDVAEAIQFRCLDRRQRRVA